MDWLEATVRKISGKLAKSFLLFQRVFRQSFSVRFHLQSNHIFSRDVHQLLSFSDLLSTVNNQQRNVENDVLELLDCLGELS